jgi:ABC-type phosphate transport system substrate-binding protein
VKINILVCIGVVFMASLSEAQGGSFKVIVHSSNPVSSLSKQEVASLFLKKTTKWKNGETVMPIDLVDGSPARVVFSKLVLGKSVDQIKAYWNNRIFSGADTPPPAFSYEDDVLKFVNDNTNALGYISSNASLGKSNVKVVTIVE